MAADLVEGLQIGRVHIRSYEKGIYMRRTRGHIKVEQPKPFTNGSALNGELSISIPPLYQLLVYVATQHDQSS